MRRATHAAITEALASTKEAAKDVSVIKQILAAASDRAMLKNATPGAEQRLSRGGQQGPGMGVGEAARRQAPGVDLEIQPPTGSAILLRPCRPPARPL